MTADEALMKSGERAAAAGRAAGPTLDQHSRTFYPPLQISPHAVMELLVCVTEVLLSPVEMSCESRMPDS